MADAALVPLETRPVRVGDAVFAVADTGPASASCVLFSHSIMTTHAMWREQIELLSHAGYRTVAYDARGHGRSTVLPSPYRMQQLADDAIALLDALDIARAHVVGLSLGGMIAFDLLTRYPQRLSSAVICDARADSPDFFARPWDERIALAKDQGMQPLASPTIARWAGAQFRVSDSARALYQMICDTPVEGFIGTARALQDFDFRQGLGEVDVPVTLICGENDGVLPAEMAALAAQIPQSVMTVIANAGHLPNLENPAEFNTALLRHMEIHAGSPATPP
ncbi:3-oxoadipate enol-lactonase [Pigmentiphaga litoralis]|uniref:alpha/beta fold hydrolase n=1 Tax=Pigmentiphaga litoralis TaxID=516702 RepID=UPI001676B7F8|nr:alpha/beta hydrolase [Pigmentiphaga litoralis]GGX23760.1 3-oxoadipate enol-lactonase [Pigmentiphaga litoralis]